MTTPTISKHQIVNGIKNGEFYLEYQPIVDVDSAQCVGFEALARWQPTNVTLAPAPDAFFKAALDHGVLTDLSNHLVQLACSEVYGHIGDLNGKVVSINACAAQFSNDQLLLTLKAFEKHLGGRGIISIELTEQQLLELTTPVKKRINKIKSMGYSLMLDDIGTGYMSMSKISELDIDGFKLSPSPVKKKEGYSRKDAAIITAIAQLAKSLNARFIIERVENLAQQEFLKQIAGLQAQGYLYGRSKPLREAIKH